MATLGAPGEAVQHHLFTASGYTENGATVVFELTASGSTYSEKIVHTFAAAPDGLKPADALVSDSSGNLYGTTSSGGHNRCHKELGGGCGAIVKLTPSGSTYAESVIYSFKGHSDGKLPSSGLLAGPNGVFYGLTDQGGLRSRRYRGNGNGIVFSVTASGSESVLYKFRGGSDGSDPDDTPGLIADQSGNLYGTTVSGGGATACAGGCGTVFELMPSGKTFKEKVLYAFQGIPDGAAPYGGVVIDSKGELVGPTDDGGRSCSCGTIFSIAP